MLQRGDSAGAICNYVWGDGQKKNTTNWNVIPDLWRRGRGHSLTACNACKIINGHQANRVWKSVYSYVFGHSKQLSLNKFFDPSTPSMRKSHDGAKMKKKIPA